MLAARFILITCCLACAAASPATRPSTNPTTKPARDWFAMSPDEFAKTPEANAPLPWDKPIDDKLLSAAVLHETNRFRAQEKLQLLHHMDRVDDVATMHAIDQSTGGWFGHVNEHDPKKRMLMDRIKLLGLNPMFGGENLLIEYGFPYVPGKRAYPVRDGDGESMSYDPHGDPIPPYTYLEFARRIVKRWWDSPPHHENIVSPHPKFLGFGIAPGQSEDERRFHKFYCVQVFFTPMPGRGARRSDGR